MNPLLFRHEEEREGGGERGAWGPPGIRTAPEGQVLFVSGERAGGPTGRRAGREARQAGSRYRETPHGIANGSCGSFGETCSAAEGAHGP